MRTAEPYGVALIATGLVGSVVTEGAASITLDDATMSAAGTVANATAGEVAGGGGGGRRRSSAYERDQWQRRIADLIRRQAEEREAIARAKAREEADAAAEIERAEAELVELKRSIRTARKAVREAIEARGRAERAITDALAERARRAEVVATIAAEAALAAAEAAAEWRRDEDDVAVLLMLA